ncbi:MAG: TraR/DksA C4-type zinc finger protein [Phenylobacterium sp.]|uniref:TraR/DksA C4-type zinc finger protein n=1 Tax=Phenylobacterium sp. TaxID=1871053 RepID=UPI00391BE6AA
MTDTIDQAQEFAEMRRQIALRPVLAAAGRLDAPAGVFLCVDCAEPIEAERRVVCPGAVRCLVCQEAAERVQRLYPRGAR